MSPRKTDPQTEDTGSSLVADPVAAEDPVIDQVDPDLEVEENLSMNISPVKQPESPAKVLKDIEMIPERIQSTVGLKRGLELSSPYEVLLNSPSPKNNNGILSR